MYSTVFSNKIYAKDSKGIHYSDAFTVGMFSSRMPECHITNVFQLCFRIHYLEVPRKQKRLELNGTSDVCC
jgi:hypothetical protein